LIHSKEKKVLFTEYYRDGRWGMCRRSGEKGEGKLVKLKDQREGYWGDK
jgi:hypothetical protein